MRRRRFTLDDEDYDPMSVVSNLFDVAMVFAVALMVALVTRYNMTEMLSKEDFTMVFPLTKLNKEGTLLNASHSYYTEEYAQRMCSLYLTDELSRDETGKIKRTYRLHASNDHTEEMAFAYEIHCPKCGNHLKQIGRQLTLNTLGLYKCPVCDRN